MATNENQRRWRERKKLGEQPPSCAYCQTKLTTLSNKVDENGSLICSACWRKTPEGKNYLLQKKKESRARKNRIE